MVCLLHPPSVSNVSVRDIPAGSFPRAFSATVSEAETEVYCGVREYIPCSSSSLISRLRTTGCGGMAAGGVMGEYGAADVEAEVEGV